ncbi:MAG: hypothetical protein OXR73_18570 [Myxococcales bacterium]|nr:hypothetical protein [Myxococcales bacterium]
MSRYAFRVDNEAAQFCDRIVQFMMQEFGIDEAEALGRVNRRWHGNDFDVEDLRYHEEAEFWASDIYYGADSRWWTSPPNLRPLPFP